MLKRLRIWYRKGQFEPGFASIFVNANYISRILLCEAIKKHSPEMEGKMLDFGCGKKPYEHLFNVKEYLGIDIEVRDIDLKLSSEKKIDIVFDGNKIPCDDNTFDSVYTSEVFEHVFNLDQVLTEINRVLKPGGKMLITIPFAWPEHEQPYDYARYTSFGITHLLKQHKFKILKTEKTGDSFQSIMQLWNWYLYSVVFPKSNSLKILLTPFFIFPFNLLAIIHKKLVKGNKDIYINNIIICENIK
jgi:SAM-dependent methyltransferase